MDAVARLNAIEEIKQLKARYFRGVDLKDWELLKNEVLDEDVSADYRGCATDPRSGVNFAPAATEDVINGRSALIEALGNSLAGIVSSHQGVTPEITVLSDSEASGIWAMSDILVFPPEHELAELFGFGHYYESYAKVNGQWKIKTLKHTRTRVATVKRKSPE